jgi:hypothetical protein
MAQRIVEVDADAQILEDESRANLLAPPSVMVPAQPPADRRGTVIDPALPPWHPNKVRPEERRKGPRGRRLNGQRAEDVRARPVLLYAFAVAVVAWLVSRPLLHP